MTVETNTILGRARPRRSLAAAALAAAALIAFPAFAGCGSSGVSSGVNTAVVHTGVSSGVHSAAASVGAGGGSSACATGVSNATKTATPHVGGAPVSGVTHANWTHHNNLAHQSFKFQGAAHTYMGPHKHNP